MAKTGRPTLYSDDLVATIINRVAEGEAIRQICRDPEMPNRSTVYKWLDENEEFSNRYTRAAALRQDELFDEMFDIADDSTNDWMEREGYEQVNGEAIARSRLRIETRKWALAKMQPTKYGDKIAHVGGDPKKDDPIQLEVSPSDRLKDMVNTIAKRGAGSSSA